MPDEQPCRLAVLSRGIAASLPAEFRGPGAGSCAADPARPGAGCVRQRTAEELYGACIDCRHSQGAWVSLYQACWPVLLSHLLKGGANHELAEECIQEVLVRLFSTRPAVHGSLLGYMRSMAQNALVTERRRQRRQESASKRWKDELPAPGPDHLADADDHDGPPMDSVAAEIARLPRQSRRLIELHFYHGLSLRQCIEALGWRCAVSTCKSRLDKALSQLARRLRENR